MLNFSGFHEIERKEASSEWNTGRIDVLGLAISRYAGSREIELIAVTIDYGKNCTGWKDINGSCGKNTPSFLLDDPQQKRIDDIGLGRGWYRHPLIPSRSIESSTITDRASIFIPPLFSLSNLYAALSRISAKYLLIIPLRSPSSSYFLCNF